MFTKNLEFGKPRILYFYAFTFEISQTFFVMKKKLALKLVVIFDVSLKIEEKDFDPFRRWVSARFNNFWVVTKSGLRKKLSFGRLMKNHESKRDAKFC